MAPGAPSWRGRSTPCATRGYASAVLWVLVTNERARRFYEIAGWSCDGTEKSEPFGPATLTETRYGRPL